jgi:hypothetical protein
MLLFKEHVKHPSALAVKVANVLGVALALVGALWAAERGNV